MEEKNKTIEQHELDLGIGTLYDMNKLIVQTSELALTEGILNSKKEIIKNFVVKTANKYYMLLSNERKDYTIFLLENNNPMELAEIMIEDVLKYRGEIRGIDITKDKQAIEIWISDNGESYVFYFFPYDDAVVII